MQSCGKHMASMTTSMTTRVQLEVSTAAAACHLRGIVRLLSTMATASPCQVIVSMFKSFTFALVSSQAQHHAAAKAPAQAQQESGIKAEGQSSQQPGALDHS